jgi:hypothetical protein
MNSAEDLPKEGFPHSDIRGSTSARLSPRLFAACHVLHRLLAPRHPPNALLSLAIQPTQHPHAVPNRAQASDHAKQQAAHTHKHTLLPRFTVKRTNPARSKFLPEGSLGSSPQQRDRRSRRRPARCPATRRQPLQDIERGERSRMIQLGSL